MTDVDLKNALLAGEADEVTEEYRDVPTKVGAVRVRGLTRGEVLRLNGSRDSGEITAETWERRVFALALVIPKMTESEVEVWQGKSKANGVIGEVANAIYELSGLKKGADKSGVAGTS
ncbi:MAG: hypothetical protein HOV78_05140 [Hamadaea sp.]|nr:hypothetical protein [Hamadaea sp.]